MVSTHGELHTPAHATALSHIQIYRPQLTSVLSIANRITGVVLSFYAVALVVWLVFAAAGPQVYSTIHGFIRSWLAQIILFGCTYSFFLHLGRGIRHLVWDAVYGFEHQGVRICGFVLTLDAATERSY